MQPPKSCADCKNSLCKRVIPRFQNKHFQKSSITTVHGKPAQEALLWEFFDNALENCFQVQEFRVMLFYGIYEHDIEYFLRETKELSAEKVIYFLKRTHQIVQKQTQDFRTFQKENKDMKFTDLIPNIITILQMHLIHLSESYIRAHVQETNFHYTLSDILSE